MRFSSHALLLGAVLLAGCGREYGALVDLAAFEPADAADDPLAQHRPTMVECPPAARSIEVDPEGVPSLEIDTGGCNYLSIRQPLLLDLRAGDVVELDLFHDTLVSEVPAEAHCALVVGEWVVFDQLEPIPSGPADWIQTFEVPVDLDAGTNVNLHLHNHGDNTWNFYGLRSLEP